MKLFRRNKQRDGEGNEATNNPSSPPPPARVEAPTPTTSPPPSAESSPSPSPTNNYGGGSPRFLSSSSSAVLTEDEAARRARATTQPPRPPTDHVLPNNTNQQQQNAPPVLHQPLGQPPLPAGSPPRRPLGRGAFLNRPPPVLQRTNTAPPGGVSGAPSQAAPSPPRFTPAIKAGPPPSPPPFRQPAHPPTQFSPAQPSRQPPPPSLPPLQQQRGGGGSSAPSAQSPTPAPPSTPSPGAAFLRQSAPAESNPQNKTLDKVSSDRAMRSPRRVADPRFPHPQHQQPNMHHSSPGVLGGLPSSSASSSASSASSASSSASSSPRTSGGEKPSRQKQQPMIKLIPVIPPDRPKLPGPQEALKQILFHPSMKVLWATCNSFDDYNDGGQSEVPVVDSLVSALLSLYMANDNAMVLLKAMIDKEVEFTVDPTTLFRGNSTPTKALTAFTKMVGKDYIVKALQGPVQYLCNPETDCTVFEIDATKLPSSGGSAAATPAAPTPTPSGGLTNSGSAIGSESGGVANTPTTSGADAAIGSASAGGGLTSSGAFASENAAGQHPLAESSESGSEIMTRNADDQRHQQQQPSTASMATTTADAGVPAIGSEENSSERDELLAANARRLGEAIDMFLKSIFEATPSCPSGFREICRFLQLEVGRKFPEYKRTAVAGFIFLRVLCPAIINPIAWGIVPKMPNRHGMRALVLVSKVLQLMANGILPGKGNSIAIMADYIAAKLPEVDQFLDHIGSITYSQTHKNTRPPSVEKRRLEEMALYASFRTTQAEMEALNALQHLMRSNLHKIGRLIVGVTPASQKIAAMSRATAVENSDKQGYLKKKGESSGSPFRVRWFVLKDMFLYYFKTVQSSSSAGVIHLEKCTLHLIQEDKKTANEYDFELATAYRSYRLRAGSKEERAEWMAAIQHRIDNPKTTKASPTNSAAASTVDTSEFSATTVDDTTTSDDNDAGSDDEFAIDSPRQSGSIIMMDNNTYNNINNIAAAAGAGSSSSSSASPAGSPLSSPSSGSKAGHQAPAAGSVVKKGYLTKRGGLVKNWKKRWFVLKDGKLMYFKTPKDSSPIDEIPVHESFVWRWTPPGKQQNEYPCCFELVTENKRTYYFSAGDEESLKSWMEAVKMQKNQYWRDQKDAADNNNNNSPATDGAAAGTGASGTGSIHNNPSHAAFSASLNQQLAKMGPRPAVDRFKAPNPAAGGRNPQSAQPMLRSSGDDVYIPEDRNELRRRAKQALNAPEREGYLLVQSKTRKKWKQRWCVVAEGYFFYFRSPQDDVPEGTVPLAGALIEEVEGAAVDFCFKVQYGRKHARNAMFRADDASAGNAWVTALRRSTSKTDYQDREASLISRMAPAAALPTKSAWICIKQGGNIPTWRKRWVVLQGNLLSYYKTPQDSEAAGVIALNNCTVRFSEKDPAGREHCFEVFTRFRTYFFMASSDLEATEWMEAIKTAIQYRPGAVPMGAAAAALSGNSLTSFQRLNEVLAMFDDEDDDDDDQSGGSTSATSSASSIGGGAAGVGGAAGGASATGGAPASAGNTKSNNKRENKRKKKQAQKQAQKQDHVISDSLNSIFGL